MEYYSAIKKNTFESVLMRWMKLEPIIPSEISQKEIYQYSIITPMYGDSQGQGSLVGCRLWGRTELDMTEVT